MTNLHRFRIFLSSPGDVAEERALAEIVFRRLASEFRDAVQLEPIIWEHEPLFAHTGPQQQMVRPSQCDLVVTILWSRLGTRLPDDFKTEGGDSTPTGTEFEVRDALASRKARGKPDLLIYRKTPPPRPALEGTDFDDRVAQYRALDRFCKELFYDQQGRVVVTHWSFSDSHAFERQLTDHVREWLRRKIHDLHGAELQLPDWRGSSPFRGLLPFEAEHQPIYFGRSAALSELLQRIRVREQAASALSPRLLLVQGMSGSGKSSLINAGLRPLLELRPVEKIARWSVVSIRPSESSADLPERGPFGALASVLLGTLGPGNCTGMSAAKLADLLHSRPEVAAAHLDEWIAAAAPRDGTARLAARLVVYIDQLEEAFAPSIAPRDAAALFGMIEALSGSESVWVIATLRSDFAYRLESIPTLVKCLERTSPYTLLPPGPGELVDIIREPARMARLLWEEKDGVTLDEALLKDAVGNPESLPLLEYTLAELYESRNGPYLRWSAYKGDLSKALVAAADAVVDSIDDAGAFGAVMRELVGIQTDGSETRRYARIGNFPSDSKARALLTRLVDRRLCIADHKGVEGPVAYLSHEALIRAWPRAQTWLKKERTVLRLRDELARDVASWQSHDRSPGYLATAPEKLAVLREVELACLLVEDLQQEFARRSRGRARRTRLLRQAALTGICVLTVLALYEWRAALNEQKAEERAADIAHHTTRFMVALFQQADPDSGQGDTITAAAVLQKGADEIKAAGYQGLQTDPAVRAELLTAMGQSYTGLGLYSDAQKLLDEATQEESQVVVPNDLKVRTSLAAGILLSQRSQFEAAQRPLSEAVALAQSLPASDILRSEALVGLGDDLSELGDSNADKYLQAALTADRARITSHPGSEEALSMLARTLDSMGDNFLGEKKLPEAETSLREAVKLRAQVYGPSGALTGQSMNNLGVVLYDSGQYQASLQEYQKALPIYTKVYGQEHREIATLLSNIGGSELMLGEVSDARRDLELALQMTEKLEGVGHEDLVPPLNRLAMIDEYENRLTEAESKIHRAADIVAVEEHSALRNQVLLTQGYLEILKGNRQLAEQLLDGSKHALESHADRATEYAWQKALWDAIDAQLVASNGDLPKARGMLADARPLLVKRFGEQGFYMLLVARVIGAVDETPLQPKH